MRLSHKFRISVSIFGKGKAMIQDKSDNGKDRREQADKPKRGDEGRPERGGTAGQSGGEEAKNRSSNPSSVQE
jgi:hypothetical protein